MDVLRALWQSTSVSAEGAWALASLGVFAFVLVVLTIHAARARPFAIRSLPGIEQLQAALGRAMETGEPLNVALGVGGLGDLSTADTLAGLWLVSFLARRGAVAEVPVRVQVAEPTALAGALAALQQGAVSVGYPEVYDQGQAEFVAPAPLAYGAGVAATVAREPMAANAMVGAFGPEVLLPGEAGDRRGLAQIGGTSDLTALPLLAATSQGTLVGEEIYALGAALGRGEHTGSLAAQDVFRALMAFGIVLVAVLGLLGL